MIHPSAEVHSTNIGEGTNVWQNCVILKNAIIGKDCNICFNVFIENEVVIGDAVTIKSGVQVWDGIVLEDYVHIGPNVTFTNDYLPRSKQSFKVLKTTVKKGATIGANSTIVGGITIGEYAMIGAGSVVTKDIPPHTLWYGNPARQKAYVCTCGNKLTNDNDKITNDDTARVNEASSPFNSFLCETCGKRYTLTNHTLKEQ